MTARNPVSEVRPRLVPVKVAAHLLGWSDRQFRRGIEEGTLPVPITPQRGRNYVKLADIDAYVESLPSWTPANGEDSPNSRPVGRKRKKRPQNKKPTK